MKYILNYIYHLFNIWWSNFFWRGYRKEYHLKYSDTIGEKNVVEFIADVAHRMFKKFKYKADGAEELGDTCPPPAEMYAEFCECDTFSDDCDGFHAGLYHVLWKNGIPCYLLSVISAKNNYGHCVVAYEYDGKTYIQDYLDSYDGASLSDVVQRFYMGRTGGKAMLYAQDFDYTRGKYRNKKLDVKTVEREA